MSWENYSLGWDDGYKEGYVDAKKEYQPQWIPCSERLPKYGQPVLTYNLEDDEYEINHIIDEEDGEWFTYGVDAWMPLPEPRKGEEE